MPSKRVAVLGASGFVGSHVMAALKHTGVCVDPIRAPRLGAVAPPVESEDPIAYLTRNLGDYDVVVNAAGVADPVSSKDVLRSGNHDLPRLLAQVTSSLGVRLIHVSSAAVQGRRAMLDSHPEYAPFSTYSATKAAGEQAVLSQHEDVCVYRPPGVHGAGRSVTRSLVRLARSPLAAVASPGDQNTPQALIGNVADAISFLTTTDLRLPTIVHHPSEGLTVSTLLRTLGGRDPHKVPRNAASAILSGAFFAAHIKPGLEGHARRLEVLWNGQAQAPSWLTAAGWQPKFGIECWAQLAQSAATELGG